MSKGPFLMVFSLFLLSCNSEKKNLISFDQDKESLIKNYEMHKALFDTLFYNYQFRAIETVSFLDNDNIIIAYRKNDSSTKCSVVENGNISSKEVEMAFGHEQSFKADTLKSLRRQLLSANCQDMSVMNDVSSPGNIILELKYKNNARPDFSFFYKIFQRHFDSTQISGIQKFYDEQKTGGILSNHVTWEYR